MKQLSKKYKEVLLPQFDDDVVQSEMTIGNELSNRITDELRMIYKVINELQKLDEVLVIQQSNLHYSDSKLNNSSGTRTLITNLKKKFALISQELSGEIREMQGKYIKYLKKDEFNSSSSKENDIESYSRNAMVESSKQIESTQTLLQVNTKELIDDQQYLLEREREIYKISQNVAEISIIFKELENIVIDQGTILDNIEYNLDKTTENVKDANKQLNKAESYQKQTRKCKVVLFLILLIILFLMILLVKPKRVDHSIHDDSKKNNANKDGDSNKDDDNNQMIESATKNDDVDESVQDIEKLAEHEESVNSGIKVDINLMNGGKMDIGGSNNLLLLL